MPWWQIGAFVITFLASYGAVVAMLVSMRGEVAEQGRTIAALKADVDKGESMREGFGRLEERVDGLVRDMEERDKRAATDRVEILSAIKAMGDEVKAVAGRLEGKIDNMADRVWDRRAH